MTGVATRVATGAPFIPRQVLTFIERSQRGSRMARLHYRIVAHDGGWAYKLGDVFSEPFPTRSVALAAARRVAAEQHVPGDTTHIEYEDEAGRWHAELSAGDDRPDVDAEA
jgi:hypothetical protein